MSQLTEILWMFRTAMWATILLLSNIHISSCVRHSLQYVYTATSGVPDFPEFVAVGMLDSVVVCHYDSSTRRMVPRQQWMKENLDQQYWEEETNLANTAEQALKADIGILKQRFNQTGGVHVVQRMYGCEWDDATGWTRGYEQYGYDGEDFIALDKYFQAWIASFPQALLTKHKWDIMLERDMRKIYFSKDCPDWLKKYVLFGSSTLERTVRPEVSLIETDYSRVVCHATGFYPEALMITWKRDGMEIQDDVDMGETLPNEDGTFQKRAVLWVSPEDVNDRQYTCEVAQKSGATIVKSMTKKGNNGKGNIDREKIPEEVVLFQRSSSPFSVLCLAEHFSSEVIITWKRDGKVIHDGVDLEWQAPVGSRGAVLNISSEEKGQSEYTCEVTPKEGEPIVMTLTVGNCEDPTPKPAVPLEVSLIQSSTSPSSVVCLAKGLYSKEVTITWKRDRQEVKEQVNVSDTLLKGDGTFQKSAELSLPPEERMKSHYTCEVTHKGGEPIVMTLYVGNIMPSQNTRTSSSGIAIGCVLAALLCAAVIFIVKKRGREENRPL